MPSVLFLLPRAGFRWLLVLLPQLRSVHVELRSAPSRTPSLFPSLFPHLPQIIKPPEATSTVLWCLGFPTGHILPLAALPAPARWAQHPQPQGTASRWLLAIPILVPKAPFSSPAEACRGHTGCVFIPVRPGGTGHAGWQCPGSPPGRPPRWAGGRKGRRGRCCRMRADPVRCRGREEAHEPGERNDLFGEGQGIEIKKSPAKIRNSGAHSAPLLSCHTSLYFIAFVQHPIVPLPFVPYSEPWLFITQPALLFSFLLFEVPERKVLFSAG